MATVFNNIDRVAEDPLSSVLVTIVLLWDTSDSPIAKVEDEDTIIRGTYSTSTDLDGYWEVDLVSNDEITPIDSVYKITERLSTNNDSVTYYISVPDNATPISWIGDILVEEPVWV